MALNVEPSSITRHRQDAAWKHCQMLKEGDRVHMKCLYCAKMFKGGGIHRFKEHLAGRKGGGPMCQEVPPDVRLLMQQILDEAIGKHKSQKKRIEEEVCNVSLPIDDIDMSAEHFDNPKPFPRTRRKKDLGWEHCQMFKKEQRIEIKCNYCAKLFKGGGIHRFKEHLAGRNSGGVPICDRVPPDVRLLVQQNLNEIVEKQKKKKKFVLEQVKNVGSPPIDVDAFANHSDDANTADKATGACNLVETNSNFVLDQDEGTSNGNLGKRKRGRGKTSSVVADDTDTLNASGLKTVGNPIKATMGRVLYDIGASLDALDSIYLQPLIDVIASGGSRVVVPSHHDFRGSILKNLVEEVKNDVDQYKTIWGRTGCSILVEEWNSESGRILLNFLVYCSKGTVFLKSMDASHLIYSADSLYGLLKHVVEEVGAGNVLQVITNGEEHYIAAGKKLMDTFPSLYWAPCVANCIDLILKDFGNLEWINAVIEQAKSVTRFIYNNSVVLNLMRKFTSGNDIVQQGVTCTATNFTSLKRMADFKLNLQTMVTSQEWMDCPYSKQLGGLAMLDIINNRSFWSSCILIIRLTSPLLRVLGIVTSEKRAAMGYVFSGMYRAKETIKRELVKREAYMVYWNIIDHRWEQKQHPPLHAAGFLLNPKFFYSLEEDMHNEILSRMFDCIERLVPDIEVQDQIVKELNFYKNADGDLGRKMAIRARETLLPGEGPFIILITICSCYIVVRSSAFL